MVLPESRVSQSLAGRISGPPGTRSTRSTTRSVQSFSFTSSPRTPPIAHQKVAGACCAGGGGGCARPSPGVTKKKKRNDPLRLSLGGTRLGLWCSPFGSPLKAINRAYQLQRDTPNWRAVRKVCKARGSRGGQGWLEGCPRCGWHPFRCLKQERMSPWAPKRKEEQEEEEKKEGQMSSSPCNQKAQIASPADALISQPLGTSLTTSAAKNGKKRPPLNTRPGMEIHMPDVLMLCPSTRQAGGTHVPTYFTTRGGCFVYISQSDEPWV